MADLHTIDDIVEYLQLKIQTFSTDARPACIEDDKIAFIHYASGVIHLADNLSPSMRRRVLAHELGHYLLWASDAGDPDSEVLATSLGSCFLK